MTSVPESLRVRTVTATPRLLVLEIAGHGTNPLLYRVAAELSTALGCHHPLAFVLDATQITGLDANLRDGGAAIIAAMRAHGEPFAVLASTLKAVEMIGAAIAFTARYPVAFAHSLTEAEGLVEAHALRVARA